jgi:hypothetical protein
MAAVTAKQSGHAEPEETGFGELRQQGRCAI